ncbi:histidinol phosphate phosphatase [Bradyrhizobium japonicum]|uniref:Histidinol phosphate phosphatase n=1 Tax=Bradyrhizobium japonicum TaxID=375 RepID=A0A0A3Y026_BRAJP|nr:H-NS histone family protein [Bradyrhizobium japonicum]KGT78771.1 histidinol phosphate phosphatase [Bradyrhizobium japonicum]MCS3897871.1 DNA-binding protein H-NS [Bradyrhizobium japonicum USDA 38]MCS3940925.1 DNA-binding protein H-NS [Bradyrhizobium japonicum]MCW2217018.1 DNA-binding protein H-NS [Bradyrhizobium japonicum]MCW2341634.1 DNA-binding protein H-NS [Bradyrhizobium japonicum]
MRKPDLDAMAFDDLWLLHEEVTRILSEKITTEKLELEKRLAQLAPAGRSEPRARRPYRKAPPKYFNPVEPSETWSGRGRQPRWLVAALQSGHKIEEFQIGAGDKEAEGSA